MSYEYTVAGQKIRLERDDNVVAVRYKEPAPHSVRAAAAEKAGIGPFENREEIPKEKFTIIPVGPQHAEPARRFLAASRALSASKDVARVAPVFRLNDKKIVATDRVLVGLKSGTKTNDKLFKKYDGTVLEKRGDEYLIQIPEDADPLQVASDLAKEALVDYAEPDFVTIGRHIARAQRSGPAGPPASDPLVGDQYAMRITRAQDAWAIQSGSPSIKIAVIDEGVDSTHEDLRDAIAAGYDGTDDDEFQEPNDWDGHGTACAGLAAAVPNSIGIRGVAGGCSILAVRIAYSEQPHGDWVTANSWIARAIDWAWKKGADVLSNSWGGGAPSTAVLNAFERARTLGRAGKGCVVIIAAGNEAGAVSFPGTLPNVLTISASNEFDQFKTKNSQDGENWWGSNFGPDIDVAAPGVHNVTTDMTGEKGYTPDNYISTFNGTSSATPIVAGAAALILSANPALTESQVRQIITNTADKVGGTPYVNGRNDQMGFGRLNVLNAMNAAKGGGAPGPLAGQVLRMTANGAAAGAFYLQSADGKVFLLHKYQGMEAVSLQVLEEQSLGYYSKFEGMTVTVRFSRQQMTDHGNILWGALII